MHPPIPILTILRELEARKPLLVTPVTYYRRARSHLVCIKLEGSSDEWIRLLRRLRHGDQGAFLGRFGAMGSVRQPSSDCLTNSLPVLRLPFARAAGIATRGRHDQRYAWPMRGLPPSLARLGPNALSSTRVESSARDIVGDEFQDPCCWPSPDVLPTGDRRRSLYSAAGCPCGSRSGCLPA